MTKVNSKINSNMVCKLNCVILKKYDVPYYANSCSIQKAVCMVKFLNSPFSMTGLIYLCFFACS